MSNVPGVGQSSNGGFNYEPPVPQAKSEVNKETFMTLLVAQLKNQDPLNPADGVEFITQLAQFSELEQLMGMREDLVAIKDGVVPSTGNTGSNNETSGAAK